MQPSATCDAVKLFFRHEIALQTIHSQQTEGFDTKSDLVAAAYSPGQSLTVSPDNVLHRPCREKSLDMHNADQLQERALGLMRRSCLSNTFLPPIIVISWFLSVLHESDAIQTPKPDNADIWTLRGPVDPITDAAAEALCKIMTRVYRKHPGSVDWKKKLMCAFSHYTRTDISFVRDQEWVYEGYLPASYKFPEESTLQVCSNTTPRLIVSCTPYASALTFYHFDLVVEWFTKEIEPLKMVPIKPHCYELQPRNGCTTWSTMYGNLWPVMVALQAFCDVYDQHSRWCDGHIPAIRFCVDEVDSRLFDVLKTRMSAVG